jgi:phage nucleotide-binding protein
MEITTIRESLTETGINFLVYGEAGVGKTSLIRTLPGRVLILSAEAGLLSLSSVADDPRFGVKVVSTPEDMREAYEFLYGPDHGFDWVVLDSFSEICEVFLSHEKAQTKDPRQAYGKVIEQGTAMGRAFRDLPINAMLTAKEEKTKDESTGRVLVEPSMPGNKLKQAIPFLFDEVFRMVVVDDPESEEGSQRWLQTQPDVRSVAKDRSGLLEQFELPDIGHLVEKIRNTKAQGGTND